MKMLATVGALALISVIDPNVARPAAPGDGQGRPLPYSPQLG
jgi:hypothetical protein